MALSMTMNLFCCMKETSRKTPEFLYEDYERFDLNAMDETECKAEFRFTKSEIPRLAEALDIPGTFFLPPRHNSSWNRRTM